MEFEYNSNDGKDRKTQVELYREWVNEKRVLSFKEMVERFHQVDKVYFYSGNMVIPALKYMCRIGKLTFSYQNYYMLRSFLKQEKGKKGIKWFLRSYCGKAEFNEKEKINQFSEFDYILEFYKCSTIHSKNYNIFFNKIILKSNFLVHPFQDFKLFLQVIIRKKDKIMLNLYFDFIKKNKERVFNIGKKTKIDKIHDGYYWLWFKIQGDNKNQDWFNKNNHLFFRTFFRNNSNLNDNREVIWDYFIFFLKKKNLLPTPNKDDLCKTIYMNEELFTIYTQVYKNLSSPIILNEILSNIINPDLNGFLLKSIFDNWKINFIFLQKLAVKIIKNSGTNKFNLNGISFLNQLIKKGTDIYSIQELMNSKYEFFYHNPLIDIKKINNQTNFKKKLISQKLNSLPEPILFKILHTKPILIKWIQKR